MEPQLCVLLYSKYSSNSKKLLNLMDESGINFQQQLSLQSLCIDNTDVRERILSNKQYLIEVVPCLLIGYRDGGIEKYDGKSVFEWVESHIQKFNPPPHPLPNDSIPYMQNMQDIQEPESRVQQPVKHKKKKKRKKVVEQKSESESESEGEFRTSIEDLPSEDELISDRFRTKKPVARLRDGKGNYIETDSLFEGDQVDMRRPPKSAVRDTVNTSTKTEKDDIMTKAREMEKSRQLPPRPAGMPVSSN
jgi:hypothetical protein